MSCLILNICDTNIPASGFFRLLVLQIVCISTSVASRSIYGQQGVRLPPIDRLAATRCINSDGPVCRRVSLSLKRKRNCEKDGHTCSRFVQNLLPPKIWKNYKKSHACTRSYSTLQMVTRDMVRGGRKKICNGRNDRKVVLFILC